MDLAVQEGKAILFAGSLKDQVYEEVVAGYIFPANRRISKKPFERKGEKSALR